MNEENSTNFSSLQITFGAPYLTVQKFAQTYGMKEKTVQDWVSKGLLPIRSKDKAGKASTMFLYPIDNPVIVLVGLIFGILYIILLGRLEIPKQIHKKKKRFK